MSKSIQELLYTEAVERGDKALAQLEITLTSALRQVRSYRAQYKHAVAATEKADQLNFALHYCASNVLPNMRFDRLAQAQASILVAAASKP